MSIYALPGPLFKLVSNGISSARPENGSGGARSSVKDSSPSEFSSASSFSIADRAENPLHRRPNSTSSSSSSSSSRSGVSDWSKSSSSRLGSGRHGGGNVVIAVKEAKIDPERLIRSLAMSGDSKKKKTNPSGDFTSDNGESIPSNSSSQRRRRSKKNSDGNDSSCKCDPHEEAIKFEFSVSFNGREYTATRTLPRILQFRYDLIEEFRARRIWRERRRKRKESSPPAMAKVKDLSDDEEEEKSIPEIPRLSEDAAGGSGFTMLNALLRPYGPALERWLMKVIDIVPHDSQCLTQFLWEPVSGHAATSKKNERRRSSSLSTLGAIQETDDLEQYDSDTDDYLLIH